MESSRDVLSRDIWGPFIIPRFFSKTSNYNRTEDDFQTLLWEPGLNSTNIIIAKLN